VGKTRAKRRLVVVEDKVERELATAVPWLADDIESSSPCASDVMTFARALPDSDLTTSEHFDKDVYLDGIIPKPWGHEYRVYADLLYDVWKLSIDPGERTSTHCHPRKETALLCLSGKGRIQRLNRQHEVSTGDMVLLRKGVFHATENIGNEPLELIEVETPRNKLDLVRVRDKYGRQGQGYETRTIDGPIASMASVLHTPAGKLRSLSLHHAYQLEVVSSAELAERDHGDVLFAVSLSLRQAFAHEIRVLAGHGSLSDIRSEPAEPYLVIRRRTRL
jgi:mannose-6-phosphate isomerase-like protein (cupin superfamily)